MTLMEKQIRLLCENGCITAEVAYDSGMSRWTCDLWLLKKRNTPGALNIFEEPTLNLFVKGRDEETLEKAIESSYQQFYLLGNQVAAPRDAHPLLTGAKCYNFTYEDLWLP